jgi:aldose sugar dehydrogenase
LITILLSRLFGFITLILIVLTPYPYCAYGTTSNAQFDPKETQGPPIINDPDLKVETVFEGIEFPATMAFLDANDILVLEKNSGTVQRIIDGNKQNEPVLDLDVAKWAERGLLGIAVARNSTNDKTFVFLYFTKFIGEGDGEGTRHEKSYGNSVYRYEFLDDKLVNPKLILDLSSEPGPAHNGGAITIGPDNNLYIPIGDIDGSFNPNRNVKTLAQNFVNSTLLDGRAGILRVDLNGNPVKSQGILGDKYPLNLYYAYGIRNSFGIDFDPVTGRLWDTENGPDFGDEINLVEPGFNSGWANAQGIWEVDANRQGQKSLNPDNLVTFDKRGEYSTPELTWEEPTGPTALKFLQSDILGKQYENDMFVSDIRYGRIYHFDLNENRTQLVLKGLLSDKEVEKGSTDIDDILFGERFGGITDLEIGPDGYLYVVSFSKGAIYRIVPAWS